MTLRKMALAAAIAVPFSFANSAYALDIVETAAADDQFTTLVQAIQAADLVETLHGPGPYTVFAPTDAAFAELPAGTVENLLQPENKDQLVELLTYHVVPGRLSSRDLSGMAKSVETVQGSDVRVSGFNGVSVNQIKVSTADVPADNGVIHVIDTVLMP